MERPVLTLDETAKLLGLSVKIVRREVKSGNIKGIKIGRKTLVLRGPLERRLAGEGESDIPTPAQGGPGNEPGRRLTQLRQLDDRGKVYR